MCWAYCGCFCTALTAVFRCIVCIGFTAVSVTGVDGELFTFQTFGAITGHLTGQNTAGTTVDVTCTAGRVATAVQNCWIGRACVFREPCQQCACVVAQRFFDDVVIFCFVQ